MAKIEIEVSAEGRFERILNREHILNHIPAAMAFSALLHAAHNLLSESENPKPKPETAILSPGNYELRFFTNAIVATRLESLPLILEPYHFTVCQPGKFQGTGLNDLLFIPNTN